MRLGILTICQRQSRFSLSHSARTTKPVGGLRKRTFLQRSSANRHRKILGSNKGEMCHGLRGLLSLIALGTAGIPSQVSENGSVVLGTRVFMHNAHPNGDPPNWQVGPFDKTLPSKLDRAVFSSLTTIETTGTRPSAMDRFVVTPLNPAGRGILLAGYDYIAMGSVNVTNTLRPIRQLWIPT